VADLKPFIAKAATGAALSREEARAAFDVMMEGDATPSQIGGFLMALRVRGETADEIAGAVASLRARMVTVEAPDGAIDIVGTGGDASHTYNISTASAFVVAGCGVPVAKHGNRALSSRSGAADVLAALGVRIDLSPEGIAACITQAGLGFMFAPSHHAAMRHVGPTRAELGTRTVFNLLGPLSNPANVRRYMLGVYAPEWVEPIALALRDLRAEAAWVVHGAFGAGGIDEVSTVGPTEAAELKDGAVRRFRLTPEDFGLPPASPAALKGGTAAENAAALLAVLDGARNAFRDVVLANASAALVVAGRAGDIRQGVRLAEASLDEGRARMALDRLVEVSNG